MEKHLHVSREMLDKLSWIALFFYITAGISSVTLVYGLFVGPLNWVIMLIVSLAVTTYTVARLLGMLIKVLTETMLALQEDVKKLKEEIYGTK